MSEEHTHESGSHLTIPAGVFYLLLAAAGLGGAGSYGVIGPQLESEAIKSCFDNSQTALNVAAQHGEEFVDIRQQLREVYTTTEADKHRREQERRDATQDRRIEYLERHVNELKGKSR